MNKKQWQEMTKEEKIKECERERDRYPKDSNQIPKINQTIERLRK